MGIFKWDDSYSVHIDTVDDQHQRLVEMINALDEAIQNGSDDTLLAELLAGLIEYTQYHFANEERVMADPSFDREHYVEHKAQHDAFVDKIVAAQEAHASGAAELSGELMEYLVAWLIDHIVGTDKTMAAINEQCHGGCLFDADAKQVRSTKAPEVVAPNLIAALRESQDRFRDLADSVPALIWMAGPDTKVQYCNQHLQGFTGKDLSFLRASRLDCVQADDRSAVQGQLAKAFKERVGCKFEYRLLHADGTYRWINESVMPRYLNGDEFLGLISCGFDVTQEKQAQEVIRNANENLEKEVAARTRELVQANEELQAAQNNLVQSEKMKSIGQLAAGVAHEINTPSQYIADNTRFLQEAFGDMGQLIEKMGVLAANAEAVISNDVIRQALDDADVDYLRDEIPRAMDSSLEGVKHVTKIVRALKDFARPSSEKAHVNLNQSIESTITVATNEWASVAKMVTDLDPKLPNVFCQLNEINQVILNGLVNSAHAIAQVVGDGSEEKGTITVSTRKLEGCAEIRIVDTGCGMTPEVKDQAFNPFFTTKGVGEGTGQGLSTAYSIIVEKHHGAITLASAVGRGTCLVIRLPMQKSASVEPSVAA